MAKTQEKVEPTFLVEIKDEAGTVIAEVQKVLHVRKKKAGRELAGRTWNDMPERTAAPLQNTPSTLL